MIEVSLPWLLTKVTSPVVGTTKFHHFQRAVQSLDLKLTEDEVIWLEELYVTHVLTGVMAQNRPERAKEKWVWSTGNQKI